MFAARGVSRVLAKAAWRPSLSRTPFVTSPVISSLPNSVMASRGYKVPLTEIDFVLNDLLDVQSHYKKVGATEATPDMVNAVLEECSKFSEDKLAPLDPIGDRIGCKYSEGVVTTPPGFKEAYSEYSEGGWCGLSVPSEYGGQGLPMSLGVIRSELTGCANWSWGMYPGLSLGAMNTLLLHGSKEQKDTYLPPMCEGRWTGTMCLTEAHCGTDLGQVKTKAIPAGDGTFKLTGTKIFISAGEHDMAENIIHIVLAKLPDAPAGTKGISLFLVPKHLQKKDGTLEEKRNVTCGGIEDKMGIKASATCVMNFEDSVGYLIGQPNDGLQQMFTFMNTARLGTGLQGLAACELSYQGAVRYARERLSMRALSGAQYPEQVADPLIVHPDVRRMLLTQRAFSEASRAIIYNASMMGDYWFAESSSQTEKDEIEDYLGFFTPICKGFVTEVGLEAASHGIQVFGGHGYIKEHGMERIYRDARISTLYEGTTGIQALDLLGRKVLMNKGKLLRRFCSEVRQFSTENISDPAARSHALQLLYRQGEWQWLTLRLALKARSDRDAINASCVDYLMYSGYVTMGYWWARMAKVARQKLSADPTGPKAEFYRSKLQVADFYFDRILPRANSHAKTMLASPSTLMTMPEEAF
mmetsp:Transcript_16349/g.49104  ORF Transcript_16349/g.49104 Transcript_16349/m.49104 type:complete len:640 (-) Transcript_16349:40-1959(-)